MNNVELVKAELGALQARQENLMKNPRISRILESVDKYTEKTRGHKMSTNEKRNVAQCLYNAILDTGLKSGGRLFEATTEDSIQFLGIQLPVIAALLPSLALNELAVVQALDRRIGAVFYLDVKYGSDKGHVTGTGLTPDTMIGAKTGHAVGRSARRYAMARVVDESVGTGPDLSKTVAYAPGLINLENTILYTATGLGTETETRTTIATCTTLGVFAGAAGHTVTGTIDTAGALSAETDLDTGTAVYIQYDYQYDLPTSDGNKDGVPEVDIAVTQASVEAIDFPLRAKYSIGSHIDLQKAHGIDLENELVKYLGNEVIYKILAS